MGPGAGCSDAGPVAAAAPMLLMPPGSDLLARLARAFSAELRVETGEREPAHCGRWRKAGRPVQGARGWGEARGAGREGLSPGPARSLPTTPNPDAPRHSPDPGMCPAEAWENMSPGSHGHRVQRGTTAQPAQLPPASPQPTTNIAAPPQVTWAPQAPNIWPESFLPLPHLGWGRGSRWRVPDSQGLDRLFLGLPQRPTQQTCQRASVSPPRGRDAGPTISPCLPAQMLGQPQANTVPAVDVAWAAVPGEQDPGLGPGCSLTLVTLPKQESLSWPLTTPLLSH